MRPALPPIRMILLIGALGVPESASGQQPSKSSSAIAIAAQGTVPQGKTFDFVFNESKIFPGTTRTVRVYVPAQYKADKAACVYVGLDQLGFNAANAFDTLIARGDMPVTI